VRGADVRRQSLPVLCFSQAEGGVRCWSVAGVQTCPLPTPPPPVPPRARLARRPEGRQREDALLHDRPGAGLLPPDRRRRGLRLRSEERRVGKEGRLRSRRELEQLK